MRLTKEELSQRRKAHYQANKERIKARASAYRAANKERKALMDKNYYEQNKEKVQKYLSQYKKTYRKANAGKLNSQEAKRRASKAQRTPVWLNEFDWLKIQCLYQLAAMYSKESGQPWHVDHIIPLQGNLASGLHVPSNLQVIPGSVNMSKRNKFEVYFG
jgi:hypothetical protein